MGDIIPFEAKAQGAPDNLITAGPWEFRRADWGTAHFLQMLRSQSAKLERHRDDIRSRGGNGVWNVPPHFCLKGGTAFTVRAVYVYRNDEKKMREVYYLAGLMDCMINQVNPVLRTDLLRDMYKKVFSMKESLNVFWYSPLDHVLLPIDSQFYDETQYRTAVNRAESLKDLYETIRNGTDEMFDILSLEYVFYCPAVRE